MRYEVRIYSLEEMLPENRMIYSPCDDLEEAKRKYCEMMQLYDDVNHIVNICEVTYMPYGESVNVICSNKNEKPYAIVQSFDPNDYVEAQAEEQSEDEEDDDEDQSFADLDPYEDEWRRRYD